MEWFWLIFWALVAGIVIGPLARLVIPGKQDIGVLATILIGAAGALIGGLAYEAFGGGETGGIDWIRLAIQVASGAVLVLIWISMKGTKTSA